MRSLLYIVLLLVVTGLQSVGSQPKELDEAQRLLASDPAGALSRLNVLDVSEFEDSATMARWALLYSEALAANRLTAPTDTIVNIAIDYYGRHNQTDEFNKATRLRDMLRDKGNNADALASALYIQKEKEFMLYKERARRERYTLVGLLIIIAAVATILWMRQRIRLKSSQNDALMAEASGLKCRIDETRMDVGRLESKLRGLLDDHFSLIDSLCQTYYESQGTKVERKAIVDKVKCEIESVRTDSFPKMEQAVNDCRGNLLERVRTAYPDIKAEDYQLLVYIASGLSSRTISLLLSESVDVVYKRKSRLKQRVKERVGESEADIMAIF